MLDDASVRFLGIGRGVRTRNNGGENDEGRLRVESGGWRVRGLASLLKLYLYSRCDFEHENGVGPARLVVHRCGCHVTMALTCLDDLGGGHGISNVVLDGAVDVNATGNVLSKVHRGGG